MAARAERRGPSVFVSCRRDDTAVVAASLQIELPRRLGGRVVMDPASASPHGADLRRVIAEAVGESSVVLASIGPSWTTAGAGRRNLLHDPDDTGRSRKSASPRYWPAESAP